MVEIREFIIHRSPEMPGVTRETQTAIRFDVTPSGSVVFYGPISSRVHSIHVIRALAAGTWSEVVVSPDEYE